MYDFFQYPKGTNMKNNLTILIVDDEKYIRDELEESLIDKCLFIGKWVYVYPIR